MSGPKMAVVAFMAGLLLCGAAALAQPGPGGGGPGGGGPGGGRGGVDPNQWRQRMMDRLKQDLGATDDEFKVLQPKIEKLMQLRMRGFSRGPRPGGPDQPSDNPVENASRELRALLENKDAKAEDIAAKLKALRDARDKARADQEQVQKELKELLTQRQEAVMVMNGWLE